MASGYAKRAAQENGDQEGLTGANVIPVFVKIENPYTFEDYAFNFSLESDMDVVNWFDYHKKEILEIAWEEGHDGIFLHDPSIDIGNGVPENIVVAFHPNQIKSIFAREFNANSPKLSD